MVPKVTLNHDSNRVNVSIGGVLNLTCRVESIPESTVHWYQKKEDVLEKVADCGKSSACTILIYGTKPSDTTVYSCVATHDKLGITGKNITVLTLRKSLFYY